MLTEKHTHYKCRTLNFKKPNLAHKFAPQKQKQKVISLWKPLSCSFPYDRVTTAPL